MEEKKMKLMLLEFSDEWQSFLHYCRINNLDRSQFTVIALQPKVRVQCLTETTDITCLDTLSFFANNAHQRALEKSQQLTHLVAAHLNFSAFPLIPHTLLDTFIYYLRFYINNYLQIIELLKGIHEYYKESNTKIELVVVESGAPVFAPTENLNPRPYLVSSDRFLAQLAREFCNLQQIPFSTIPAVANATSNTHETSARKRIPAPVAYLAKKLAIKKLQQLAKQPVILLAALSYNLDRLFGDILQRIPAAVGLSFSTSRLNTAGVMKFILKECRNYLRHSPAKVLTLPFDVVEPTLPPSLLTELIGTYKTFIEAHLAQFVYEGCALTPVLETKVTQDLLPHLAYLYRLAHIQQTILGYVKPKLLLSPVAIDHFLSWGELCRANDIPAVAIPQKGLVAPQNSFAQIEEYYIGRAQVTECFQYAVAQTPYVKQYLSWAGYPGTVLETGNLIFARSQYVKKSKPGYTVPEGKRVIVYAPSMKSRKSHRFFVLETLDELIASLTDVINAVAMLPDAHLLIRIHPGEPITRKEIEALCELAENVSISDKGSFEEVLACAAITLSFSSTSIQESLLNGIPVVLYDRWQRYNHLDAVRITGKTPEQPATAYYVDEAQKLSSTLRWLLDLPPSSANNKLFLNSVYPASYSESFFKLALRCCSPEKITKEAI